VLTVLAPGFADGLVQKYGRRRIVGPPAPR
jgi:hypothetical protein